MAKAKINNKLKMVKECRDLLKALDFHLKDGSSEEIYEKYYNSRALTVNLTNGCINYKEFGIESGRDTTSNLSEPENLVVLECVDKLLSKGYSATSIFLEKRFNIGRSGGGWLDILVSKDNVSYMMIECKTFGSEYKKAKTMLLNNDNSDDSNQLLSYFANDKNADVLVLYSSRLNIELDKIEDEQSIIYTGNLKNSLNAQEVYKNWDKKCYEFGIFEEDILPYQCRDKMRRKDLKELSDSKENGSGYIYNQFLEILRHNGISDKPNAFNKILNLFLCKIVDEEKGPDEEVEFYWSANTTLETMQSTLNKLYKKGMEEYLNIHITDYSEKEIKDKLSAVIGHSNPSLVDYIVKVFQETRYHKSSEFAFKEIYNEETFVENAKVLKEIVELLQPYQFRYAHKQQFLGTFFENLLSTSIKQEVGQFFTPIPIAKFMITSLPLEKALYTKAGNATNGKSVTNVIPTVIDYSCGAGHFLTEFMDLMQSVIDNCDTSVFNESVKKKVKNQQNSEFDWASDCVYGIEKDYRLVKTTKISTFLNGDGEANIIHADGLTAFGDRKFKGLLSQPGQFDFVIANPPYSVNNFKAELTNTNFTGYSYLTNESKEIECLFVERTAQLLKVGGYAAVILPTSVIYNSGIYEDARQNILKYFYIRGIAKMGKNTFMSTNVETVILFLERRSIEDYNSAVNTINRFMSDKKDFNYGQTVNIIEEYARKQDLSFEDYVSILELKPTDNAKKSEYYHFVKPVIEKYLEEEKNNVRHTVLSEKEKLVNFILTHTVNCVICNTGEKDEEKAFLGYEFSNRRGSEGLHEYDEGSSLYDVSDPLNDNVEKVNYLIRKSFLGENIVIPECLKNNVLSTTVDNIIDFIGGNKISINPKILFSDILKTNCEMVKLNKVCDFYNGFAFKSDKYSKDGVRIIRIANVQKGYIEDKAPAYYPINDKDVNKYLLNEEDLLMSLTGNVGRVGILTKEFLPAALNQRVACIRPKKENIVDTKYLYYLFSINGFEDICYSLSTGIAQKNLSTESLGSLKIPVPCKEIQDRIIKECENIDLEIRNSLNEIRNYEEKIETLISNLSGNKVILGDKSLFSLGIGQRMLKKEIKHKGKYPVYSANVFKAFGYSDELLPSLTDFSKGSAVWGIDTDWQVNYFPEGMVFRPTDHFGYLRANNSNIAHPYILSKLLYKAGLPEHFTRDYRASVDSISKLSIILPKIEVQNEVAKEALSYEEEINKLKLFIRSSEIRKQEIISKLLID